MNMIRQGIYLAWDLDRPMAGQPNPRLSKPSAGHEGPPTPEAPPLPRSTPHPPPTTQPHTHGKVEAAKQRMETKPRPTLASSQPSWAHSPNTSQIHWTEPLGQVEKLLAPSVLQTMAAEGGSQKVQVYEHRQGVRGWQRFILHKGKKSSSALRGLAPFTVL